MPSYPSGISSFQAYVSSDGSYWQNSKVTVSNGQAAVTVPGYGVATLYGVGLNANASSAVGVPVVGRGADGNLQITFSRDAARDELSYVVEGGNDLADDGWTAIATSTGGAPFSATGGASVSETGGGSVKTVTVDDLPPTGGDHSRRFLRVRVTE